MLRWALRRIISAVWNSPRAKKEIWMLCASDKEVSEGVSRVLEKWEEKGYKVVRGQKKP